MPSFIASEGISWMMSLVWGPVYFLQRNVNVFLSMRWIVYLPFRSDPPPEKSEYSNKGNNTDSVVPMAIVSRAQC